MIAFHQTLSLLLTTCSFFKCSFSTTKNFIAVRFFLFLQLFFCMIFKSCEENLAFLRDTDRWQKKNWHHCCYIFTFQSESDHLMIWEALQYHMPFSSNLYYSAFLIFFYYLGPSIEEAFLDSGHPLGGGLQFPAPNRYVRTFTVRALRFRSTAICVV